jgi:hypothetical protein
VKIRLTGVYNSQTITHLKDCSVNHFGFDLRPKSFNFIQAYKIQEILTTVDTLIDNFYLHFENEKDYVISEISSMIVSHLKHGKLFLEFSGDNDLNFYDQFSVPYLWHFNEKIDLGQIEKSQYLQRIVLEQNTLEHLNRYNRMYDFLNGLAPLLTNKQIELELKLDWDSALMEAILDFYPVAMISFGVNSKVEKSFRQIDLQRVQGHIEHTIKTLNS